ncbi:hypothetical protein VNI00_011368 [Paramarasmius palmivorus]|uniref:Uncharacterized protein n=1 Tax=Paramarasmius palmivorus TaxID=297713 RepID=A0AAW0CDK2_9AGAR
MVLDEAVGLSLEAVAGGGGQLHTYFLHAHVALWGIAVVSVGVALALVQTGHQLLASLEDSGELLGRKGGKIE